MTKPDPNSNQSNDEYKAPEVESHLEEEEIEREVAYAGGTVATVDSLLNDGQ